MSCISHILNLKENYEFLCYPIIDIDEIHNDRKPNSHLYLPTVVEGGGIYKKFEYLITFVPRGYVAIPNGNKYDLPELDDEGRPQYNNIDDIDCYGGITFMSREHDIKELLKIPCNDIWIGFDCMHIDDNRDFESSVKYYGEENTKKLNMPGYYLIDGVIRDFEFVEKECKLIIDQIS